MVAPSEAFQEPGPEPATENDRRSEDVVHAYRPVVVKFFRRRGCSLELAEDLTQEVLIRVWKSRDKLNSIENLRSWLKTIAVRVWTNHWRDQHAAKRGKPELSLDQQVTDHGEGAIEIPVAGGGSRVEDPSQRIEARSEIEAVRKDLATLPPRQRQVLRLVLLERRSNQDTAKILGVSVSTVKSHLSQGRSKLRELRRKRDQRERS